MLYSISDLEKLSGIQAHTIRIWEQRYQALQPLRSAGNTRHYEDSQLKRLLNIVSLSESGLKISQICALSDEDMKGLIQKDIEVTSAITEQFEPHISQLIISGLAYDEVAIDQLLSNCIKQYGLADTYKKIIYPLLLRLGLLWQKDSICPAQEHFLSSLIRQKLFAAIDTLPPAINAKATWLLFLPEGEEHDIGLLFAKYLLRNFGEKVIYLGSHVPMSSLIGALKENKVDHLLFFMTQARLTTDAQKYLNSLAEQFPTIQIHLSGSSKLITDLNMPKQVTWFKNIETLESFIHPNETSK
ncbi:DNA-binding transcriptional MerR regulator/methylmalonyl-CoA mutase cobalamin-binding subunit [Pedobacter sp. CG_S7]|uniref:MerR family transcriptional regulator n=1 Tax=Pedobacter sp. CG_S7 TaxID=3143930 RepID=UPI00339638A4